MKSGLRCVTGSSSAAQPASPPSTTGSSSAAQPASPHVDTRDAAAGSAEQPAGQNVLKNRRGSEMVLAVLNSKGDQGFLEIEEGVHEAVAAGTGAVQVLTPVF